MKEVSITSDFENITNFDVSQGRENFYWVFTFRDVQKENFDYRFYKSLQIRDDEGKIQFLELVEDSHDGGIKIRARAGNTYLDNKQYTLHYSIFNVRKNESKKFRDFIIHLSLDLGKELISNLLLRVLIRIVERVYKTFDGSFKEREEKIAEETVRKIYFTVKDKQVNQVHIDTKVHTVHPKHARCIVKNIKSNVEEIPLRYVDVLPGGTKDSVLEFKMRYNKLGDDPKLSASMFIEAPNGETFGYGGEYLTNAQYCQVGQWQNECAKCCRSATYSGYNRKPEEITFLEPMPGRWKIGLINAVSRNGVEVEMESNHPLVPVNDAQGYKITFK